MLPPPLGAIEWQPRRSGDSLWRFDSSRSRRKRSQERFTSRNELTNHNDVSLGPERAMSTIVRAHRAANVWLPPELSCRYEQ